MKASFKVVQFKCPSYNALNGLNVERNCLRSHTSNGGEFFLAHIRLPTHQIFFNFEEIMSKFSKVVWNYPYYSKPRYKGCAVLRHLQCVMQS